MQIVNLVKNAPRYLAYGFLHFFASSVGQTFFISLFVLDITNRMNWGDDTFAYVYSSITLVAAFLLPLVGKQIDRLRIRYVSLATAVLLAMACFLIAGTTSPLFLVSGLFVVRLGGQGVMPLIGSTTIGRYFTLDRGKALSLSLIGIPVAEIIIPLLVVWILAHYGFSVAWSLAGGILLLVFIPAIWLLIKKADAFQTAAATSAQQEDAGEQRVASWTRDEVLKDLRFRLLIPAFLITPFVMTGMMFTQAKVAENFAVSASWLALAISGYGAARALCMLFGGSLADRFGPEKLPRFLFLPMLVGLLLFVLLQNPFSILLFFALSGVTAGVESVVWPALWSQRYGPRYLGSIKSTIRVMVVLVSAAAPVIFSLGIGWSFTGMVWLLIGYALLIVGSTSIEYSRINKRLD